MLLRSTRSYESGSSFSPAFLFLEPEKRRALSALYGFARAVDDIADEPGAAPEKKEAALAAWKARLEDLFAGGPPRNSLEADLIWAAGRFSMRLENLLLLLEGVGMDARPAGFGDLEALKAYMYRVASAVGLSCLEIFGWRGEKASAYAENLGYAVQLTNIIRDVFEDARAGRVYLPAADLARFGCSPSELENSIYPRNFVELMRFEAERARAFYAAAGALAAAADGRKILPALIMGRIYAALLDKLEKRGFRTAGGRVRLDAFEKFRAVCAAWKDSFF